MTIKLVQGLVERTNIGQQQAGSSQPSTSVQQQLRPENIIAQAAQVSKVVTQNSEAVVTAVRSARVSPAGERVRDPKEAENIAKGVADKIKSGADFSSDSHSGLEPMVAQDHLAN